MGGGTRDGGGVSGCVVSLFLPFVFCAIFVAVAINCNCCTAENLGRKQCVCRMRVLSKRPLGDDNNVLC